MVAPAEPEHVGPVVTVKVTRHVCLPLVFVYLNVCVAVPGVDAVAVSSKFHSQEVPGGVGVAVPVKVTVSSFWSLTPLMLMGAIVTVGSVHGAVVGVGRGVGPPGGL